jgi:hypothetical protein
MCALLSCAIGTTIATPWGLLSALLVGYFEGIDGERGIAWRAADSLALRRSPRSANSPSTQANTSPCLSVSADWTERANAGPLDDIAASGPAAPGLPGSASRCQTLFVRGPLRCRSSVGSATGC